MASPGGDSRQKKVAKAHHWPKERLKAETVRQFPQVIFLILSELTISSTNLPCGVRDTGGNSRADID